MSTIIMSNTYVNLRSLILLSLKISRYFRDISLVLFTILFYPGDKTIDSVKRVPNTKRYAARLDTVFVQFEPRAAAELYILHRSGAA